MTTTNRVAALIFLGEEKNTFRLGPSQDSNIKLPWLAFKFWDKQEINTKKNRFFIM